MKKFYSLALGLMLGAFGFSANAATTAITPSVTPSPLTPVTSFEDVTVSWGGAQLALNPEAEGYEEYDDPALTVKVLLNNQPWVDWFFPVTVDATIENGNTLKIQHCYTTPDENAVVSYLIPAGAIFIGENEDTNAELVIDYNYINIPNDQTTVPAKGATVTNISSVVIKWQDLPIVDVNPDCSQSIVYGYFDMEEYEFSPIGEIPAENIGISAIQGTATITFEEPITENGTFQIRVPDGFFLLGVNGDEFPTPEFQLQYNISDYVPVPADGGTAWSPFSTFSIYADESVALVDPDNGYENIELYEYNGGDEISSKVASCESVTSSDNMPGLKFTLDAPYVGESIYIVYPANTLKINGVANEDPITVNLNLVSLSLDPADGDIVAVIDVITINCGEQETTILQSTENPTITYGTTTVDINDVKIIAEEQENMFGTFTEYSVQLTLENPIVTVGEYELTIPANLFEVSYGGGVVLPNQEITANYTVAKFMTESATEVNTTLAMGDPNAAIELSYPVTVTLVDAESVSIPVYMDYSSWGMGLFEIGTLDSTYIQLQSGEAGQPQSRAETGDSGTNLIILAGASELFMSSGEYIVELPAGLFKDANDNYSLAQTINVIVEEPVEGDLSPYNYSSFLVGSDVEFTITYEGTVEQNYSEEPAVIIFSTSPDSDFPETSYTWEDTANLYIDADNSAVVINFGKDLPIGAYYVYFNVAQVLIDGKPNALQEFSFYVLDYYPFEAQVSDIDEDGVVEITWQDMNYFYADYEINPYLITPESGNVNIDLENILPIEDNNYDYIGIQILLSDLVEENGDYTLVIPEAYLEIEGDNDGTYLNGLSRQIEYSFYYEDGVYTGINVMETAPVKAEIEGVYNLQGMKVDANKLTNGIYIINGKKVLIRK